MCKGNLIEWRDESSHPKTCKHIATGNTISVEAYEVCTGWKKILNDFDALLTYYGWEANTLSRK